MIETLSGASGSSAVPRTTRCAPESCHSTVTRPPPGHVRPSGYVTSNVHSPTRGSSLRRASTAVGWSIALLLLFIALGHHPTSRSSLRESFVKVSMAAALLDPAGPAHNPSG